MNLVPEFPTFRNSPRTESAAPIGLIGWSAALVTSRRRQFSVTHLAIGEPEFLEAADQLHKKKMNLCSSLARNHAAIHTKISEKASRMERQYGPKRGNTEAGFNSLTVLV